MVQIAGKYELVENKNFYEFLVKVGVPEAEAKKIENAKSVIKLEVDGKKYTMYNETEDNNHVSTLVLGEEVEEKMPQGFTLKSTSNLDGNVLTVDSKHADGKTAAKRIFTFSDSGVEVQIIPAGDDPIAATRIYKRT